MNDAESLQWAMSLGTRLLAQKRRLVTAESCTGGMIAATITALAGSSDWFERGLVTYSNDAKVELLGVPETTLATAGAVSEPAARAMAEGALARSTADLAAAITGVAGPEPDDDGNPVGRVYIAAARRGRKAACVRKDYGAIGRDAVREAAIADAIAALRQLI